jgi:hypothetical protein
VSEKTDLDIKCKKMSRENADAERDCDLDHTVLMYAAAWWFDLLVA